MGIHAMSRLFETPAATPTVVVLGGANMDIVAHTESTLALGDSNPGKVRCAAGGVGRNVAHNLALLGLAPALVSVLGTDVFAQSVLETTRAVGVDTRWCLQLPDARTATYLSLHGPDGDMAVAINDMDILARLGANLLEPLLPVLHAATCLVLDSNLHDEALSVVLGGSLAAPVLVDAVSAVKCPRLLPWLDRIHTLKVNRLEAAALTGLPVQSTDEARAAALALHQRGVVHVVLSLGAQGVVWCDAQGLTGWCAARAVPVVNTSGAGDALLAGLVYAHLQGQRLEHAVHWAMACAEITLQSPCANAPELSLASVHARLAGTV